jgi:hypothetical protein
MNGLWKPTLKLQATADQVAQLKARYGDHPNVRYNRKSVAFRTAAAFSFGPRTASNYGQCAVALVPVAEIRTDEARFQNRGTKYSEESVNRIVQAFDPNRLDPVVLWRDVKDGRVYMLSGHSRLEAHKRLQRATIPAKFFVGTEAEAIRFAKVDANRGATQENVAEDVKAYRLLRDGDPALGIAPHSKKDLQARFKGKWQKLDAYTYLNPNGTLMQVLAQPTAQDQFKYLANRAATIGLLRKQLPQLTNLHEEELVTYWWKSPKGHELSNDDLTQQVTRRVQRVDFDPTQPLSLERAPTTGTDARADTREAQQQVYQLRAEETKLRESLRQARTKAEKEALTNELMANIQERERLERGIRTALKSQTALFGVGELSGWSPSEWWIGFGLAAATDFVLAQFVRNAFVRMGLTAAVGYYYHKTVRQQENTPLMPMPNA